MNKLKIDKDYLIKTMAEMINIPSPSGYTDQIVHYLCGKLKELGLDFEITRRGAVRAIFKGEQKSPARAVIAHLDTLGGMVKNLKPNGRLEIVPVGFWSSRFAEGCRVTIFTDAGPKRGTILPLKASGHTYNKEIDVFPIAWDKVEVRVDEKTHTQKDLIDAGFNIGDFISIDPCFEITPSGFINSRHLDNKAGVASLLAAVKALVDNKSKILKRCHLLFTISEEVGSGASAVLHGDVAEMVSIDNSTIAPGQNSSPYGITVAMKDSSGPFDYHLTKKILGICEKHKVSHTRDVFRYYRCDAASAIEAGNDIRTALVCFACDASHNFERTHIDSLENLAQFLSLYMQSPPTFERDQFEMGTLKDFPSQPTPPVPETSIEDLMRPDNYEDEE